MQVSRRGIIKIAMLGTASLWAACRRAGTGAPVPTLAEISHIQAVQTAQADLPPSSGSTPVATAALEQPAESEDTASSPQEAVWPSVKRGPEGILVTWPLERFYETRYRNASPRPDINVDEWELAVEGWVQTPQTLTFALIADLPQVEVMRTLECISNPVGGSLIGNTAWRGVRLADVLALAGVRTGARELKMVAADGYETSIPLELATHDESLLVFEMDGAPLSVKHGYPLRVLLPGRYGQKQPKWITRLEVITEEFLGYWEQRGWSNEARVQINSQIWEPSGLTGVSGQSLTISGIAFSDESGVSRVEVSTDGGLSWADAELFPGPHSLIWTEWRYTWQPPAVQQIKPFTLAVRATNGSGRAQRLAPEGAGLLNSTFPDGTSDIHRIVVQLESSS